MTPVLHFVSGWGVPHCAWDATVRTVAPSAQMIVHDATAWLSAPPDPEPGHYLGGWSLGGQLALQSALRRPGAWAGLLLAGTTACFCRRADQAWGSPDRHLARMMSRLDQAPRDVLQAFYALCAQPHDDPAKRDPTSRSPTWADAVLGDGTAPLRRGLQCLRDIDLRQDVLALPLPTVLLHGRRDAVVPWEAGAWLERHLQDAEMMWAEEDGHDLPMRRPRRLLEAIEKLTGSIA